jgi:membrane protein implicated in regulation of membrane protease activity
LRFGDASAEACRVLALAVLGLFVILLWFALIPVMALAAIALWTPFLALQARPIGFAYLVAMAAVCIAYPATAARLESHGEPDKIQLSESTALLVKRTHDVEERGTIELQGQGGICTYWLLGRRGDARR